ncbi:hypothetical protein VPARA_44500 [Variovorax paradoxus]|uniref:Uncharacterized protein n=1 Tax=Variovorax paradoxus TaxID=34073 RepID=A0A0H2LWC0_VARPD|nr:hypothetical protein VPARA_44500 [Variovorax paradoxus]
MPKLAQLMARFWLPCVMVVVLPLWLMLPLPALTLPPLGPAHAPLASSAAQSATTAAPRPDDLPRPLAVSGAGTKRAAASLQTRR